MSRSITVACDNQGCSERIKVTVPVRPGDRVADVFRDVRTWMVTCFGWESLSPDPTPATRYLCVEHSAQRRTA
jgi:hypothetical protein